MKTAVAEAPDAPRVGADLRAARERLGWHLPDVARALRIRLPYLAALEDGRIADLPGNAYAVGFLRTYGAALGLDPDELSRRFKAEAATVNRKIELAFPAPLPERGMPTGAVLLLGLVLVVGAYIGWYRLSGEGRLPAETVPPVPQRLATLVTPNPPAVPAVRPAAPGGTVATGAAPNAIATASPAGSSAGPAGGTGAIPVAPPAPTDFSPTSAAAATTAPAPAAPMAAASTGTTVPDAAAAPGTPAARVVLAANADAWMEVRDASGKILLNRVLHAGETWPVPPGQGLRLTTGNAGGTYLIVDGVAGAPLGRAGAVRRDLTLDPDQIKAGALAQAAPNAASLPVSAAVPAVVPPPSPATRAAQPGAQGVPAR